MAGDALAVVALEKWRVGLRDQSCTTACGQSGLGVRDTAITAISSRMFKLKASNFLPIERVSRDGLVVPSGPVGFRTEVLSQAKEFYSLRKLRMDLQCLLPPPLPLPLVQSLVTGWPWLTYGRSVWPDAQRC